MKNNIIIYKSDDGKINVELYEIDGNIWLNQKQISELFASSRANIAEHIINIYNEKELDKISTCRDFRQVRNEGNRTIEREITYYNLDMILAVGFRIRGKRGT